MGDKKEKKEKKDKKEEKKEKKEKKDKKEDKKDKKAKKGKTKSVESVESVDTADEGSSKKGKLGPIGGMSAATMPRTDGVRKHEPAKSAADRTATAEKYRQEYEAVDAAGGKLPDADIGPLLSSGTHGSSASARRSSVSSQASLLSYPDTEPEVIAQPPPKPKSVIPDEARLEIKRKMNMKFCTNKEGRREVYRDIALIFKDIADLSDEIFLVLAENKHEPEQLPVIKGFAEARGLFKRRKTKCLEILGDNKDYLDAVRLHRYCLVDGVLFNSKRDYSQENYAKDMTLIKGMKRGIMRLMGKDPDQWEYDPEEFEELRKVRGQLNKVWGGHFIKRQKEMEKAKNNGVTDPDVLEEMRRMQELLKAGVAPSAFQVRKGAKPKESLWAKKPAVKEVEEAPAAEATQEANWAADALKEQEAPPPPQEEEKKEEEAPPAPPDMMAYSVDSAPEEIDVSKELADAMDSFIPDKFYRAPVEDIPDDKHGRKFAGDLAENKPDGRGVLIFEDKSQHIGNFHKGKANGVGVFLNRASNSVHCGCWVENRKSGKFYTLDKGTGQTWMEVYENDELKERTPAMVIPQSALQERFMKKLARIKAKDSKSKGDGNKGDADKIENRRGSVDEGGAPAAGGERRESLPKV